MSKYPERIICMTEESVELLYLLGEEKRIVGVSSFVERPEIAKSLYKVSAFTHANIRRIKELRPDLILGFSDIQKDIARDLIAEGFNVFIANQRSVQEIFNYCLWIGAIIGKNNEVQSLIQNWENKIQQVKTEVSSFSIKPRVYFEEWDGPLITAIKWVGELIEICGAENVFSDKSQNAMAKDRFVSHQEIIAKNPEIILACWCGKKVDLNSIYVRPGYEAVKAIQQKAVLEVNPSVFLQPGPALFEQGLDDLFNLLRDFQ